MTNRCPGAIALGAMALLSACQIFAPAAIQRAATARVQGSVYLPAKQILVGYRTQAAALVEKPGVGAVVRMVTRDGQALSGLSEVKVDDSGAFAFQQEVPEGLYLVVASFGEKSRVMAFVRVKAGSETHTVLTAASTMVANRLGRTPLKLTALQQADFDAIAAQARSMMTDDDVGELAPEAVSRATDDFLNTHLVIQERIQDLLGRLARAEGLGDDPLATLPVTATPAPEPSATPAPPDPIYTPVPKPSPTTLDPATWNQFKALGTATPDSTPYWVEMEGPQFLWVSCPASNSIMRFDRAKPEWSYSRVTTNVLRDRFVPAQLAIDETAGPVVWVGNQRSDGTRVARYDEWGNFLGSIDAGPGPSVIALDSRASGRDLWIGLTGDDSGKIVVADPAGRLVSTGNVAGKPFRMIGCSHNYDALRFDKMWIATRQALYGVPLAEAQNPTMSLAAHQASLGLSGELRGLVVDPFGYVSVVLQDAGHSRATLLQVDPLSLQPVSGSEVSFDTTAPIVSLMSDYVGRLWVVTENQFLRVDGGNVYPYGNSLKTLGAFPGHDPAFWTIHQSAPQLVKRAYD